MVPETMMTVEKRSDPLGVLISGRGSNLEALIRAVDEGRIERRIAVVIANRPDAAGLAKASAAGIETMVLPHGAHPTRAAYDEALVAALRARGVGLVCLAGFMRLLGPVFCRAFPEAVLNVHPSLLPAFPGVEAQAKALAHGVRVTGATVHFVTPELDAGPIVMQEAVLVEDADTVETLSTRILAAEHRIFPAAVSRVIGGHWRIDGRRVRFDA